MSDQGHKAFNENRDRLRRQSEQRVQAGLKPFPTVEELAAHPNSDKVAAHNDLMEVGEKLVAQQEKQAAH